MATKQNRVMITVSDQNLEKLEAVKQKTGMSKSAQIQSLIAKYLASEYELAEKGEVHEGK
jgi:metal-responsive CopG/Arc/MetJ family transcriptional regulator